MPRTPRRVLKDGLYHVLNRANGRLRLFRKPGDFAAFVRVLGEAQRRYRVDLLCWCLMGNHWHLVLRPRTAEALGDFMRWVGVTHVRRHHEHHQTRGGGHLYQGRFRSFLIKDDRHFLTVCRYVESNPLRARLVKRAESWPWSSLGYQTDGEPVVTVCEWPVERPRDWIETVNEKLEEKAIESLRRSVNRQSPFGDQRWVERMAKRLGLESTLRPIGRPRKAGKVKGDRSRGDYRTTLE